MKFKPLHDRVLIEVLDSSEKTAGGIIIPDSAQEKPQEGKVVAVGMMEQHNSIDLRYFRDHIFITKGSYLEII